jgi:hypothetical protein
MLGKEEKKRTWRREKKKQGIGDLMNEGLNERKV